MVNTTASRRLTTKRRPAMGDTGKKNKDKHQKQKAAQAAQEAKRQQEQKEKQKNSTVTSSLQL